MIAKNYLLVLASFCLFLSGCNYFSRSEKNVVQENPSLKVINVNDTDVYQDAHIKGDIHLPYSSIDSLDRLTASWNKKDVIVLYCSDYQCSASKIMAKKLKALGFENVKVYSGGAAEWYQLSQKDPAYQLSGPAQLDYLKKPLKVERPDDTSVEVISAQELLKLLKDTK